MRIRTIRKGLVKQPGAQERAERDREGKQRIHRPMGEIAAHVAKMRRQHRLARIPHTQIQVELCAKPHEPQDAISHQTDAVGTLCESDNQQEAKRQNEYFMPKYNARCGPEALQTSKIR